MSHTITSQERKEELRQIRLEVKMMADSLGITFEQALMETMQDDGRLQDGMSAMEVAILFDASTPTIMTSERAAIKKIMFTDFIRPLRINKDFTIFLNPTETELGLNQEDSNITDYENTTELSPSLVMTTPTNFRSKRVY